MMEGRIVEESVKKIFFMVANPHESFALHRTCWACGRRSGDEYGGKTLTLHEVKLWFIEKARDLTGTNRLGHSISVGHNLCCLHFRAHKKEKWRESTFPGMAIEGSHVPKVAVAPERKIISRDPPPMTDKDRIRELKKTVTNLQKEVLAL